MPSARQLAANQRNAQKCKGPTTDEGKAKSRFNGLKHGLTAAAMILPFEDPAAYHELRAQILDDLQPQNPAEWMIADQLVSAWWRTLRARKVEAALMKMHTKTLLRKHGKRALGSEEEFYDSLAVCFATHSEDSFKNYERHNASIERAFYRAWDRFQKLKAKRPREVSEPPKPVIVSRAASNCSNSGLDSHCSTASPEPTTREPQTHRSEPVGIRLADRAPQPRYAPVVPA